MLVQPPNFSTRKVQSRNQELGPGKLVNLPRTNPSIRSVLCDQSGFMTRSLFYVDFLSRGTVESVERPSKGPGSVELYWRGFGSRPQHKVVGKSQPCTVHSPLFRLDFLYNTSGSRSSQVIFHPGTAYAQCCLTAAFDWSLGNLHGTATGCKNAQVSKQQKNSTYWLFVALFLAKKTIILLIFHFSPFIFLQFRQKYDFQSFFLRLELSRIQW